MPRKSLQVERQAFGPAQQVLPASLRRRAITAAAELGSIVRANTRRTMRVGFIGLDHTGEAMASRLLKAGHQLTVYDPAREIPETLAAAGASAANSIQDACRSADAVFTMFPNDETAEAMILGPGGVVESLPRNAIHIGSSTVSIECADRIVEAHWDAGQKFVSAPVVVRSQSSAEMQLLVIAGGHEAMIIEIEPLLSPIGQLAQLSGWPSDANLVQLEVNCSGTTPFQFLAHHLELRARQDRSQLPRLVFLGVEPKLHIGTKGVVQ